MKAPKGKRSPKPMDWAAETRLTRWRRRAAAIALAVIVLLGVVGGAVSNARAGALQSRLRQQSQIEYVYKMDTPFRKAERFVRAPGAILNHRVSSPSEIPSPWTRRSWVSDTAGILSPGAVKEIDGLAKEVQRGTGAELVVVTVPGVQGAERDRREVKRFATQLFNSWGLGDRYKNNGVLVLVSTGDRRVEVEIGRGLNQVFNREEWLQRMIHSRMTPALRHNRYDQGVTSGVAACCQQLEDTDREVSSPQGWRKTATLLWVGSGLAALATPLLLRSWVPAPRCGLCGTRMSRLRPAAAEELLPGQRAELELGSVRHVLCGCGRPGCQKRYAEQGVRSFQGAQRMGGAVGRRGSLRLSPEEVRAATPDRKALGLLSEPVRLSRFRRCASCGFRAALTRTSWLVPATTLTPGFREETTECYFCSATSTNRIILPILSSPSSSDSSGGGGGSSDGGGSGGDF